MNIETTNTGIQSKCKVAIEGGSFKTDTYTIYLYSGTENNTLKDTLVEGIFYKSSTDETTIINSNLSTISNNQGTLNIQDCVLNNDISNSGSNNIMTLNKITQTSGRIVNSGTMTMNDINMEFNRNNCVGITSSFYNSGRLFINNSSIKLNDKTNYTNKLYGLYNYGLGTATLNNTSIKVTTPKGTAYGLYSHEADSIATILGGAIEAADSTTAYGIYINGTVTLGEAESSDSPNYGSEFANVSTEYPLIKGIGTTSGIGVKKVSGYFNYYDGKLVGSTSAKPDATSEVEYDYEVSTYNEEDTGYEYNILEYIKRKNIELS